MVLVHNFLEVLIVCVILIVMFAPIYFCNNIKSKPMKTFLVILNSGEKVYIDGDDAEIKDNIIYISNEIEGRIAILTNIAMIVNLACINNDAAKKHDFQFSAK